MAACWLNQYHPRNKTRPWCANASRGKRNRLRNVLQSTATKIVTKLMNWNQYRVGTLLQRVQTDCLGRKFSPQRSQYTGALPEQGTTNLQSLSGYCERRSKNYWPDGQFWSRSYFLHKSFEGQIPPRVSSHRVASRCVSALWFRLCARSAEPSRLGSRFPPFFLQLVHFFLEVRFFSLQIPYLAIPILNVRNVVFHSRGHVKSAGPVLLYVVLQFRNLLFGCGYLIQQHTGFPAPICLVPSGHRHDTRLRFSSGLLRPCRAAARWFVIPHDGDAIAAHSGQIFFGVHLFRLGLFLLRVLRRVSPSFAFLLLRLRLCLRRILVRLANTRCCRPQYGQKSPENLFATIAVFHER